MLSVSSDGISASFHKTTEAAAFAPVASSLTSTRQCNDQPVHPPSSSGTQLTAVTRSVVVLNLCEEGVTLDTQGRYTPCKEGARRRAYTPAETHKAKGEKTQSPAARSRRVLYLSHLVISGRGLQVASGAVAWRR